MILKFNRLLGAALAVTLTVALAACGGNDDPEAVRPRILVLDPQSGASIDGVETSVTFRVEGAPAAGYAWGLNRGASEETLQSIAAGTEITIDVTLVEGQNDLRLALRDAEGEADAEVILLRADVTRPVVELADFEEGAVVYGESFRFQGSIVSARLVTRATLTINDREPVPLTLTDAGKSYGFASDLVLDTGENTLVVAVTDDQAQTATSTYHVHFNLDEAAPTLALTFPRDDHAVRTRRVHVSGDVDDNDGVVKVWLVQGESAIDAVLEENGGWRAALDLEPGDNAYAIKAEDRSGNVATLDRSVYFGARLGAGGANGGAVIDGQLYMWGRNNLGQAGIGTLSHETQATWCDRIGLGSPFEIAVCKATSITAINALCDSALAGDADAIAACKGDVATRRTDVCTAAGASAPTNCATSTSANLWTACNAAHPVDQAARAACKVDLVCASPYGGDAEDLALCQTTVGNVPLTFPAPSVPQSPAPILPGTAFVSVALGQNAASALDAEGDVWSWGDGGSGMLCLGDSSNRTAPVEVADFGADGTRAIALSRGYDHLLVLRSDGSVWGCGLNNVGQLGDGTSGNERSLPVQVIDLPADIVQVQASSQSSYALTRDGQVYAWGRNQYGNLGQGTVSSSTAPQAVPLLVPGLTGVVAIASGRDHVLAVETDGTLWAWGLNGSNQVGPDELTTPGGNPVASPVRVAAVDSAVAVYGNANQGFYEDRQGRLYGWGQNLNGTLGIPDEGDLSSPTVAIFGLSGVTDAAIGGLHGFAMMPTESGLKVFAWGWSFFGSLGGGPDLFHAWAYRTPLLVPFP